MIPRPLHAFTQVSFGARGIGLAVPGDPDLFIATDHFDFITDVGGDDDLAPMWQALEQVYRFSGGRFLLMQRLFVASPAGAHRHHHREAPVDMFFATCSFWTHERPVPDNRLLLLELDPVT